MTQARPYRPDLNALLPRHQVGPSHLVQSAGRIFTPLKARLEERRLRDSARCLVLRKSVRALRKADRDPFGRALQRRLLARLLNI